MKTNTCRRRWLITSLLLWLAAGSLAQAFYDPSTGRWLNRDPIAERGFEQFALGHAKPDSDGRNLYAFVHNDPIASIDYNGLFIIPIVRVYPDEPFDPRKTHVECWTCNAGCLAYFACFMRRPGNGPQLNPAAFAACMAPIDAALPGACRSGNVSQMDSLTRRAKNCFDHHW